MRKVLATVLMTLSLVACSNWNRQTPKGLDNKAIEAEVRKNLTADKITGVEIDVSGGVVTLTGHMNSGDKAKALEDARKVNGVTTVVDRIAVQ